jgi:hypothetical protein
MMKQSAESIAHRRLMAGTPEFGIGNAECGMMKQSAESIAYRRLIAEALDCGFGFGIWDFGFKDPPQMKLHKVKSEPQNREYRISNVEGWFRFAQSFL